MDFIVYFQPHELALIDFNFIRMLNKLCAMLFAVDVYVYFVVTFVYWEQNSIEKISE